MTSAVNPRGRGSAAAPAPGAPDGSSVPSRPSMSPVTVRQTPLTAMESPGRASSETLALRIAIRAESPAWSIASTSPRSSTMPVNIRVLLRSVAPGDALARVVRALAAVRAFARSATAGHDQPRPAARVLPPIRTLTVGPGIPPGQPAAVAAGSRTVTAGSEFHRPRSTLALWQLVCHTTYSREKPGTGRPETAAVLGRADTSAGPPVSSATDTRTALRGSHGGTVIRKRPYHAFLSHAHVNKAQADSLYKFLARVADIPVWYDAVDLPPGASFARGLYEAIEKSRSAIILLRAIR